MVKIVTRAELVDGCMEDVQAVADRYDVRSGGGIPLRALAVVVRKYGAQEVQNALLMLGSLGIVSDYLFVGSGPGTPVVGDASGGMEGGMAKSESSVGAGVKVQAAAKPVGGGAKVTGGSVVGAEQSAGETGRTGTTPMKVGARRVWGDRISEKGADGKWHIIGHKGGKKPAKLSGTSGDESGQGGGGTGGDGGAGGGDGAGGGPRGVPPEVLSALRYYGQVVAAHGKSRKSGEEQMMNNQDGMDNGQMRGRVREAVRSFNMEAALKKSFGSAASEEVSLGAAVGGVVGSVATSVVGAAGAGMTGVGSAGAAGAAGTAQLSAPTPDGGLAVPGTTPPEDVSLGVGVGGAIGLPPSFYSARERFGN